MERSSELLNISESDDHDPDTHEQSPMILMMDTDNETTGTVCMI